MPRTPCQTLCLIVALAAGLAGPVLAEDDTQDAASAIAVAPIDRHDGSGTTPPSAPATTVDAEASADAAPAAARPELKDRLLEQIGEDLQSLGAEIAIDELNRLARYALDIERPDLFRTVMVSQVDEHWAGLSDARTALNMIAWLPDTADNLSPRITAARLAISEGELPDLESQRLWRDLRARVERVGDPDLLFDLASAMIRSASVDLLVDTVNRFHSTDRKRIETFVALLEAHGPNAQPRVADMLYRAIMELGGAGAGGDRSAPDIARAFWAVGRTEEAFLILFLEPDPLVRLRTRFELLARDPVDKTVTDVAEDIGAPARIETSTLPPADTETKEPE